VTHVVAPGETWASLAEDYYGRESRARELRRANPGLDAALVSGQEIFVPLDAGERDAFARRSRARAPYNRGLDFAQAGAYPDAIVQFLEAIAIDGDFAAAHYNLGLVYRRAGRLELALESLSSAVRLRRGRADYHFARAVALKELGRTRDAERGLRRALDRDGSHLPALHALARLLDERGKRRDAARYWRRVLALDPGGPRGEEARLRLEGAP